MNRKYNRETMCVNTLGFLGFKRNVLIKFMFYALIKHSSFAVFKCIY